MRIVKIFTSIAVRRELLKTDPFDHIRLKKGSPTLIYLSTEERDKLVKMFTSDYTYEKHKRVLHYFLFACFTGLRISDIKLLRWENISNDTLYIMPFKTRRVNQETVIIPLGAKAKWLLSLIPKRPRNPYVFDMISEQKTNLYLKEIADLVGINKRVYFHVARHTFATLFYERTNDLATLQKLLGHSSIAQTMVYAHVSDQLRREQMHQFDQD
jgi:integrase